MSEDAELERLKAKRLRELERRIIQSREKKEPDPRQELACALGYRGLEVLQNAEAQFPVQMRMLVPRLAAMVSSGELGGLNGGQLLQILRLVGLNVRMPTRISVEKDGKFITLAERLGGRP